MPTKKQLFERWEQELEFPETRAKDDPMYRSPNNAKPIVMRSVCSLKYDHEFLKGTGIDECPECGESFLQTDA